MSPAQRAAIALSLMAGFYLLAIASGAALLALAVFLTKAGGLGGLKLAFLSAAAGGTVLWSLRPRVDRFEPPGPLLTRDAQPDLFSVIDDVASASAQAMPVEVYATPDVNAFVSTRGGVLGIGGRRSRRSVCCARDVRERSRREPPEARPVRPAVSAVFREQYASSD